MMIYLQILDVWILQQFDEITAKTAKRTQTESATDNLVISERTKYRTASDNVQN